MENKQTKIKHDENLRRRIAAMLISFWFFIFMSFVLLFVAVQPAAAQANPCDPGQVEAECDPPSFRDIEVTVASCVTSSWALAGMIFGYYFISNIVSPYFSMDPNKMSDASKAFWPWLAGFIMFFLTNPLLASFMRMLINTEEECYGASAVPGFSVFFPTVCTEGDPPIVTSP